MDSAGWRRGEIPALAVAFAQPKPSDGAGELNQGTATTLALGKRLNLVSLVCPEIDSHE